MAMSKLAQSIWRAQHHCPNQVTSSDYPYDAYNGQLTYPGHRTGNSHGYDDRYEWGMPTWTEDDQAFLAILKEAMVSRQQ